MAIDLISELRASAIPRTHVGDCMIRAAAEIERLRADLDRFQKDRAYVVGWHDGYAHGFENGAEMLSSMLPKMHRDPEIDAAVASMIEDGSAYEG